MERSPSADEAAAIAAAIARVEAETAPAEVATGEAVRPGPRAGRGEWGEGHRPEAPRRRNAMAVVKIIELVGSSKTSTDDAARQALAQAQGTLRNVRAVDIVSP